MDGGKLIADMVGITVVLAFLWKILTSVRDTQTEGKETGKQVSAMAVQVDAVDHKVDTVDRKVDALKVEHDHTRDTMAALGRGHEALSIKVDKLTEQAIRAEARHELQSERRHGS